MDKQRREKCFNKHLFLAWQPSVHRRGSFSLPEAGVSSLSQAVGVASVGDASGPRLLWALMGQSIF